MESICSSANEFYVVDALLVFFFLFLSMPRIPLRFPSVFPFLEGARLPFLFLDYFERLVDEVARSLRSHVIALSLSLSLSRSFPCIYFSCQLNCLPCSFFYTLCVLVLRARVRVYCFTTQFPPFYVLLAEP